MHRNILGLLAAVALVSLPQIALADGDHMRHGADGGAVAGAVIGGAIVGGAVGAVVGGPVAGTAVQFDNVDDQQQ